MAFSIPFAGRGRKGLQSSLCRGGLNPKRRANSASKSRPFAGLREPDQQPACTLASQPRSKSGCRCPIAPGLHRAAPTRGGVSHCFIANPSPRIAARRSRLIRRTFLLISANVSALDRPANSPVAASRARVQQAGHRQSQRCGLQPPQASFGQCINRAKRSTLRRGSDTAPTADRRSHLRA